MTIKTGREDSNWEGTFIVNDNDVKNIRFMVWWSIWLWVVLIQLSNNMYI